MRASRSATVGLVIGIAAAWAASLVISGLWLALDLSGAIPGGRWIVMIAGAGFIAAGEFVFLVAVADKLMPRVGRRVGVWAVEMALLAVVSACFALCVLTLVWSLNP